MLGKTIKLILVSFVIILFSGIVYAQGADVPQSPEYINEGDESRRATDAYPDAIQYAAAGNVSHLVMNSTRQTESWQGYAGNVSGLITLDDSNNWTLYDWTDNEPQGQIYAASSAISNWETAHCFNYTPDPDMDGSYVIWYDGNTKNTTATTFLNLTYLENSTLAWSLGVEPHDRDGVNETFRDPDNYGASTHDGFFIGNNEIRANTCPAIDLYENDSAIGDHFQELLLTVNNTQDIIYAAVIENNLESEWENDVFGYNNITWDFEMIVGEDGHNGDEGTTPYYFYIQLS